MCKTLAFFNVLPDFSLADDDAWLFSVFLLNIFNSVCTKIDWRKTKRSAFYTLSRVFYSTDYYIYLQ